MKEGKNGVTANTPKNILFGAGTIHKGLTFTTPVYSLTSDSTVVSGKTYYTRSGASPNYTYTIVTNPTTTDIGTYYEKTGGWNYAASIVGATSGGSKLAIVPEITKIEIDGALVPTAGLSKKTGEAATMEVNFAEITPEIIKAATIGKNATSSDGDFVLIESKADIENGDYWENIAFVGETLDGENIIAILDNALCTSGLNLEGKNKSGSVSTYTFESHAKIDSDLDILPWHIYYPNRTA